MSATGNSEWRAFKHEVCEAFTSIRDWRRANKAPVWIALGVFVLGNLRTFALVGYLGREAAFQIAGFAPVEVYFYLLALPVVAFRVARIERALPLSHARRWFVVLSGIAVCLVVTWMNQGAMRPGLMELNEPHAVRGANLNAAISAFLGDLRDSRNSAEESGRLWVVETEVADGIARRVHGEQALRDATCKPFDESWHERIELVRLTNLSTPTTTTEEVVEPTVALLPTLLGPGGNAVLFGGKRVRSIVPEIETLKATRDPTYEDAMKCMALQLKGGTKDSPVTKYWLMPMALFTGFLVLWCLLGAIIATTIYDRRDDNQVGQASSPSIIGYDLVVAAGAFATWVPLAQLSSYQLHRYVPSNQYSTAAGIAIVCVAALAIAVQFQKGSALKTGISLGSILFPAVIGVLGALAPRTLEAALGPQAGGLDAVFFGLIYLFVLALGLPLAAGKAFTGVRAHVRLRILTSNVSPDVAVKKDDVLFEVAFAGENSVERYQLLAPQTGKVVKVHPEAKVGRTVDGGIRLVVIESTPAKA